jgi:hypothetical protein
MENKRGKSFEIKFEILENIHSKKWDKNASLRIEQKSLMEKK